MNKIRTKDKVSITIDDESYKMIENIENKSKYIESLLYKKFIDMNLIKKEIYL